MSPLSKGLGRFHSWEFSTEESQLLPVPLVVWVVHTPWNWLARARRSWSMMWAFLWPEMMPVRKARLPMWFGFAEFRRTRAARAVTRALRLCCPPLTFGHWWVWIQKPGQAPA